MRNKSPGTDRVFVKKKTGYKELMSGLYDYLERFSVFVPLLGSVLKRFRVYLNNDPKECCAQAMGCLIKIYISGALAFCLIFGLLPSWHTFAVSLYLIYFFSKEFTISAVIKLEVKFLKSFDTFLGIVRHYYYKCGFKFT